MHLHVTSHHVKRRIELTLSTRSCSSVVAFRFFKFSPKSALLAFFSFFLLRSRRSLSLRRIAISSEADEDEDAPDVSSVPSSSWSVHEEEFEATDLIKADDEQVKLDLKFKSLSKVQESSKAETKNVFKSVPSMKPSEKDQENSKDEAKRKQSALEEIMEQEKKRKKVDEAKMKKERSWLRKNIIVKVITKSLGDKYYKKKGYVREVIDDFAAVVVMNDTGAKVKLDQDHLETVVPQEGREVIILWGEFEGETAILRKIDTDNFSASVKLDSGKYRGEKVKVPYEQFSKKHCVSD